LKTGGGVVRTAMGVLERPAVVEDLMNRHYEGARGSGWGKRSSVGGGKKPGKVLSRKGNWGTKIVDTSLSKPGSWKTGDGRK